MSLVATYVTANQTDKHLIPTMSASNDGQLLLKRLFQGLSDSPAKTLLKTSTEWLENSSAMHFTANLLMAFKVDKDLELCLQTVQLSEHLSSLNSPLLELHQKSNGMWIHQAFKYQLQCVCCCDDFTKMLAFWQWAYTRKGLVAVVCSLIILIGYDQVKKGDIAAMERRATELTFKDLVRCMNSSETISLLEHCRSAKLSDPANDTICQAYLALLDVTDDAQPAHLYQSVVVVR
ncbi:hypothetical protein MIR68_003872 [Amoeboaphelidium protococcarum]|nr:hypothetical protein MIR68_003872 [Amoeboaphelidium protococcarum]